MEIAVKLISVQIRQGDKIHATFRDYRGEDAWNARFGANFGTAEGEKLEAFGVCREPEIFAKGQSS